MNTAHIFLRRPPGRLSCTARRQKLMVHIRYLMGHTLNADCKETFGGELLARVNDLAICYKKTRTKTTNCDVSSNFVFFPP